MEKTENERSDEVTGYADLVTQVRMEAGPLDPRRGAGGGGGAAVQRAVHADGEVVRGQVSV